VFHVERMNSSVALVFLLFVSCVHVNGWWLTIPSANNGSSSCGSLISDSYFWDTENNANNNRWFNTIPRGDYGVDIRQYFCTGNVDSMPFGSYCFYQNRQNSHFFTNLLYFESFIFIISF